jgi:hypothetical protein
VHLTLFGARTLIAADKWGGILIRKWLFSSENLSFLTLRAKRIYTETRRMTLEILWQLKHYIYFSQLSFIIIIIRLCLLIDIRFLLSERKQHLKHRIHFSCTVSFCRCGIAILTDDC